MRYGSGPSEMRLSLGLTRENGCNSVSVWEIPCPDFCQGISSVTRNLTTFSTGQLAYYLSVI